jgi:hypothetical protein
MKMFALSLLLPTLVGPVTFLVMQSLKKVSAWVDMQSPLIKRIAVALIAFALTFLAKLTGVTIPCEPEVNCLAVLDQDAVKAAVGALLAYGLHFLKNAKKPTE